MMLKGTDTAGQESGGGRKAGRKGRRGEECKSRRIEDKMEKFSNKSIILSYTVSHGGTPL